MVSISQLVIIVVILVVALVLVFVLRERQIRKKYQRMKQDLDHRQQEINREERYLLSQKEELQKQLEQTDEQNALIHQQTLELEKNRHSLERTIELRTQELTTAKQHAEESDRLKTAFLANISHEIRTPMNAIMGFSSLLGMHDSSPSDQEMYVHRIMTNSQMLLNLIDGILDMSKLQAGQMKLMKIVFPVNKLLEDILSEVKTQYPELDNETLKLELSLPEGPKKIQLFTDPQRLQQVLQNLLSNAIKYTEKGTVRFGYTPIFNSNYEKEPSNLQFFVEDTGIGISSDKADFIFNWFNKIEEDTSKIYRGAGLGLYLSKALVELMGGKIWFNSREKVGSSFYFSLPYMNTSDLKGIKTNKKYVKQKTEAKQYDWRKKKILVVEDEQHNIVYLSEIIRKTGATVILAGNGEEALNIMNQQKAISLVLMDLMMPEMNGYDATREIKKIKPTVPIIAQTAYTNANEKEKSLEAGCDGYISKPYNPPELLKLIDTFLA